MKKYLVKQDRPNCIGCGACAAICPEQWEMGNDGKSTLKGGKAMPDGSAELEISEKDYDCHHQAADVCPTKVISVVEK